MDASLWVAKTGLDAQQTRMNVISNNLANVNTTGFKRDRAVFEDLLYQNIKQPGGQTSQNTLSPTGLMLGTGVKINATEKLHLQGNIINTAKQPIIAKRLTGLSANNCKIRILSLSNDYSTKRPLRANRPCGRFWINSTTSTNKMILAITAPMPISSTVPLTPRPRAASTAPQI